MELSLKPRSVIPHAATYEVSHCFSLHREKLTCPEQRIIAALECARLAGQVLELSKESVHADRLKLPGSCRPDLQAIGEPEESIVRRAPHRKCTCGCKSQTLADCEGREP